LNSTLLLPEDKIVRTPSEPITPKFSLLEWVRMIYAAGGELFTQSELHVELARVEWAEEKIRLLRMLLALLCGVVFLTTSLLCASALLMLLTWNTPYRILALVLLVLSHSCGVGIVWWRFHLLAARSVQAFSATRQELAADLALFRRTT
jgi:uncharacterized membrane protein YqjE